MARQYNWKTGCDVEATLTVIGGRWKPILICRLLSGKKRFGELCRLAPNATERMITLQLRELEADGVIKRTVHAEVPPRVEYEVTEYGRSLQPIIMAMQSWGKDFKTRKYAEEEAAEAADSEHEDTNRKAANG
ncbi:winged helix-turn-helix transcriptional regulator [Pacificoceanicola onchidii]|uniref:winged helix-turn-helix transcriptional regulator n=1 Tax=Pacificoceanicola onchidii TaxID=2562685 RepID=UPI0010A63CF4|nr:winged helix-turn-helix transcriptional regulator [Pacificoceanicola onchidii]